MSKFYVSCGPISLVVTAVDTEAAAMQLIDRALQPHRWIYDDAGLSDDDRRDHLMLEALMHLAPEVTVSERGHGRCEAARYGTPDAIQRWHATTTAIARLMAAAGLVPINPAAGPGGRSGGRGPPANRPVSVGAMGPMGPRRPMGAVVLSVPPGSTPLHPPALRGRVEP